LIADVTVVSDLSHIYCGSVWLESIDVLEAEKMKIIRLCVLVFLSVALIGILLPSARADQSDKETRFTCSEPVRVAGTVLQPGTYWFKLEDLTVPRNMVVIRDANRTHIVARVNAILAYRPKPEEHTTFDYWNTSSGGTLALHTWFYPGELVGFEFALNS